jgi:signal transduction histidine kinase
MRISIAAIGCGMDRGTLRRLFQHFVSTKGDSGTGLGLWVSREILDKHHAIIRVRSQSPGESGTVFSIWIPETTAGRIDVPEQVASQTA